MSTFDGENVDPYGDVQNASFTSGGGTAAGSPMLDFSISASAASTATDFTPDISDVGSNTGGSTYIGTVYYDGVAYNQFADIGGTIYEILADPNGNGVT